MSTAVAIGLLVALFLAFPLIKRERGAKECGTGGCWKKKVGMGCGSCPVDEAGGSGDSRG